MKILKQNGSKEDIKFDRILNKIKTLSFGLSADFIECDLIAKKVIEGIYDGITTKELDVLTAEVAAGLSTFHPDYNLLAGRVLVSRLHKETSDSFSETMLSLYDYYDPILNKKISNISEEFKDLVLRYRDSLDNLINHKNDFTYDFFAYKTLEKSYLLKRNNKVVERPQYLLLRVALAIHKDSFISWTKVYNQLSAKKYIHASPTLFNAGTKKAQLSSCFLVGMKEDSISGIYDTLKECALISKSGAGIGLYAHNIRATGSYIAGTNGRSNGLIPMLQVFNHTARYVDQGGGKRKGAFAIYLEPWYSEILAFLDLRKNHGKEELRARDLFLGLWIPDLFMKRVIEDKDWSLFSPSEAPNLYDVYGEEFDTLYVKYENESKAKEVIKARKLWDAILKSQIETGTPFLLYKDACNKKSNQKNLGTIKSSNLCTEIIQYSDKNETGVCNLASISLPACVINETFDFNELGALTKQLVFNLNNIIDYNDYPTENTKRSNLKHRPIGIGVQGLADTFFKLKLAFDSDKAKELNKNIFEVMYYNALKASNDLALSFSPYKSFKGSPLSEGKFQFDLWNKKPSYYSMTKWNELRDLIIKFGVRNSLLIAPMPTASTAQILGNNECFEPCTFNIYNRRTLSGEFVVLNKYLINDLIQLDLWNEDMRYELLENNGSIQLIKKIPFYLKEIYRTAWELKQKSLIDMSADRAIFICQSQSLNLFIKDPQPSTVSSMNLYSFRKGLKTGIYYLRSQAATSAQQFTLSKKK